MVCDDVIRSTFNTSTASLTSVLLVWKSLYHLMTHGSGIQREDLEMLTKVKLLVVHEVLYFLL